MGLLGLVGVDLAQARRWRVGIGRSWHEQRVVDGVDTVRGGGADDAGDTSLAGVFSPSSALRSSRPAYKFEVTVPRLIPTRTCTARLSPIIVLHGGLPPGRMSSEDSRHLPLGRSLTPKKTAKDEGVLRALSSDGHLNLPEWALSASVTVVTANLAQTAREGL